MSKWHLIENQPLLREIYKDPPLLSYRKGKSLEKVLDEFIRGSETAKRALREKD